MVEDKSLKAYKSGQRSVARNKDKHRHKKPVVHLVPAALEAGGALLPAYYGPNPGIASYLDAKLHGQSTAPLGDYVANTMGNIQPDLLPMAEMIVGGMVLKWVGKKTGLNRIGTKEVKIL